MRPENSEEGLAGGGGLRRDWRRICIGHLFYYNLSSEKRRPQDWYPKAWAISFQKVNLYKLCKGKKHGLFYRTH